ncbi:unnamed protein product [Mesocestoides corti]|uniref:Chorein N-terminal domain-containing protein n=1 Tax=Mesocestoides corti TaxID=53468 RepID=A0A3P6HMQ8_MESCO|nr:unnamed protein product [Mesocestoides corti]
MENVDVRATAFDEFSMPVRVVQGHIRVVYDEGKERQYRRQLKQKTLEAFEELKKEKLSEKTDDQDSFLEKLAAQVIKNVQVKITNIHIRYEDQTTIPSIRFSAGLTLSRLAFQYYEDELDVMNLVMARQHAEIRAAKRKASKADSSRFGGGWFSWLTGSSGTTGVPTGGDDPQLLQRVKSEMTAEEKQKLYTALNYSEGMSRSSYPADYVSTQVNFSLGGLTLALANNELNFSVRLVGFEAVGTRNTSTGIVPVLISSTAAGESLLSVDFSKNPIDRSADQRLLISAAPLEVIYDADTINKVADFFKLPADLRLDEISSTVVPSLDEMKAMTTTGLRHLVSQRTYLDVVIDIQPSYFILPDLGVYKEGCRLILVDFGSVSIRSTRAQLDLPRTDEVNVTNQEAPSASSEDKASITFALAPVVGRAQSDERYKQLMQANHAKLLSEAYDQFNVTLSATQVIVVEKGENWRTMRSQTSTTSHVLKPLGINFVLRRCTVPREFNLPQFQVDGRLPLLGIDLTDHVLESLLDIVAHIPLPEADSSQRIPVDRNDLLKDATFFDAKSEDLLPSQLQTMHTLRIAGAVPRPLSPEPDPTEDENDVFFDSRENADPSDIQKPTLKPLANLVTINATFLIEEVRVRVFERLGSVDSSDNLTPLLMFTINEIGANFTLRRWDQEIKAHVNRLRVISPRFQENQSSGAVCLVETLSTSATEPISSTATQEGGHLFTSSLLIADKTCPDFATKYENVRHSLVCEFRVLKVRLHKDALLSLMTFFTNLATVLSKHSVQEPSDDANQRAFEWAHRLGDKEASARLQEESIMTEHDARLSSAKITPVDAITGIIARKNERRDIRLGAAFEAAKMGEFLYLS